MLVGWLGRATMRKVNQYLKGPLLPAISDGWMAWQGCYVQSDKKMKHDLKGPLLLAISDGWMAWQGRYVQSDT